MSAATAAEGSADGLLGPREQEVRRLVRGVAARDISPRASGVDADEEFAAESYQALVQAGLAGLWAPADLGGTGDSTLAYAVAMEEIAAACPSTSTIYMTQMHAGAPIEQHGVGELRTRCVSRLARGEAYGSLAITEPDAGSDAAALTTTARRDGDAYVLDGQKSFITTGNHAEVVLLFATVDRSLRAGGITAFCVEAPVVGLSVGQVLHKMGMRGSPAAELFFSNCRIPAECRLGSEGSGWTLLLEAVNKSRISAAAQGVGVAQGAYAAAVAWARRRGLLDPGSHQAQATQFSLVDLRMQVAAARHLLYRTAAAVDTGDEDVATQVSMAKAFCTDTAMDVALAAADLLGADGDREDLAVERYVRDAKVTQIYDGTNQIQRLLVARSLARQEA